MHVAAVRGQATAITALVEVGALLEAQAEHKLRPLHIAAAQSHKKAILALVKAGASLEAVDDDKRTPFDLAPDDAVKQALSVANSDSQESTNASVLTGVDSFEAGKEEL